MFVPIHLRLAKTGTADASLQSGQCFITEEHLVQNHLFAKGTALHLLVCKSTVCKNIVQEAMSCVHMDGCLSNSLSRILPHSK